MSASTPGGRVSNFSSTSSSPLSNKGRNSRPLNFACPRPQRPASLPKPSLPFSAIHPLSDHTKKVRCRPLGPPHVCVEQHMRHAAQTTGTSGVVAVTTHQKRRSSVHCSSLLARGVHAGIQWRQRAPPPAPALAPLPSLRLICPPACLRCLPRLAPAQRGLRAVVARLMLCCGQLFTPQLPSSPVQRLLLLPLGGGAASGIRRLLQAPPNHLLQLAQLALRLREWT